MNWLIITLIFLIATILLYRISKRRIYKVIGLVFGIASVALYFLMSDMELASTPAVIKMDNQTERTLNPYFFVFYIDAETRVVDCPQLTPGMQSTSPGFELEGSTQVWLVTTTGDDLLFSINKEMRKWNDDQIVVINRRSIQKIVNSDGRQALEILEKYRLQTIWKSVLITLNVISIIWLLSSFIKTEIFQENAKRRASGARKEGGTRRETRASV